MRPLPSTVICFNSNQRNFSSSFPILFLFISSISVLQWLSLFFPLHLNYLSILKFLIFQHDLRFGIAVLVNSSTRSYVNNSTIGIPVRSNDIDISMFLYITVLSVTSNAYDSFRLIRQFLIIAIIFVPLYYAAYLLC